MPKGKRVDAALKQETLTKLRALGAEPEHGSLSRLSRETGISYQSIRKWHLQAWPDSVAQGPENGTPKTVVAEAEEMTKSGEPLNVPKKETEPEPELSCLECGGDVILSHGKTRAICVDSDCGASFDVRDE